MEALKYIPEVRVKFDMSLEDAKTLLAIVLNSHPKGSFELTKDWRCVAGKILSDAITSDGVGRVKNES